MVVDTNATAKWCPALQDRPLWHKPKQLDQKHHMSLPPQLSPPPSSSPSFPAILIPLPNPDRNAMQRLKKKKQQFFLAVVKILKPFNLY